MAPTRPPRHPRPSQYSDWPRYRRSSQRSILGCLIAGFVTALAALSLGTIQARADSSLKVYFVVGQQLVPIQRPGNTIRETVSQLIAGPTSSERGNGSQSYLSSKLELRAASLADGVATVDLGAPFADPRDAKARNAALAQLVYTVSSVPGVESVQLLINGQAPTGLFPGFDPAQPITTADVARPKLPLQKELAPTPNPPTAATRKLQQQLANSATYPPQTSTAAPEPKQRSGSSPSRNGPGSPATASPTKQRQTPSP
jgi:hypothetical protein